MTTTRTANAPRPTNPRQPAEGDWVWAEMGFPTRGRVTEVLHRDNLYNNIRVDFDGRGSSILRSSAEVTPGTEYYADNLWDLHNYYLDLMHLRHDEQLKELAVASLAGQNPLMGAWYDPKGRFQMGMIRWVMPSCKGYDLDRISISPGPGVWTEISRERLLQVRILEGNLI